MPKMYEDLQHWYEIKTSKNVKMYILKVLFTFERLTKILILIFNLNQPRL